MSFKKFSVLIVLPLGFAACKPNKVNSTSERIQGPDAKNLVQTAEAAARQYASHQAPEAVGFNLVDSEGAPEIVCPTCLASSGLALIKSASGNYEAFVPRTGGGISHYTRDISQVKGVVWTSPKTFAMNLTNIAGIAALRTNKAVIIVLVTTANGTLLAYTRPDTAAGVWSAPTTLSTNVKGQAALMQSAGGTGNTEVVVPLANGGIGTFWRENNSDSNPWHASGSFADGVFDSVAMIESADANFRVVARKGTSLLSYWRNKATLAWASDGVAATGVTGIPAIAQNSKSTAGDLEVLTPLALGGIGHVKRAVAATGAWQAPIKLTGRTADSTALIQDAATGDLQAIARFSGDLAFTTRVQATQVWTPFYNFAAEAATVPALHGRWNDAKELQVVGIHSTVLSTGKVLLWDYGSDANGTTGKGDSAIFDPTTSVVTTLDHMGHDEANKHPNMFCAGQVPTPDGRIIVFGGAQTAENTIHTFDIQTNKWTFIGPLTNTINGRWYGTATALADGQSFIISGTTGAANAPVNNTWQTFDPVTSQMSVQIGNLPVPFSTDGWQEMGLYPLVYPLPDGKVGVFSHQTLRFLDTKTKTWSPASYATQYPSWRTYPVQAGGVIMPLTYRDNYKARLLIAGGGGPNTDYNTPANPTVEMIDLSVPAPAWKYVAPLKKARVLHDLVTLPDGTLLALGGSLSGKSTEAVQPVMNPEVYDPATDKWTLLAPMRVPRLYHQSSVLLPDGRVLVAGKDDTNNQYPYNFSERRVEIFEPPYLFKGPRPVLKSVPPSIGLDISFDVEVGDSSATAVNRVVIVRPGSVTHSVNMNQRLIELEITARGVGKLTLKAPPTANIAQPGVYMMFLVSGAGVPSLSKMILLPAKGVAGAPVQNGRSYTLAAKHSNQVVDVSDVSKLDNAVIWQWGDTGAANQKWTTMITADGTYQLVSNNSGKCLSQKDGAVAEGTPIVQLSCTEAVTQRWIIQSVGGGFSTFKSPSNSKCLTVPNGSLINSQLVVSHCIDAVYQQFNLR